MNSMVLAMSDSRGLNEIINMLTSDPKSIDMLTSSEKTTLILFVAGLGMAVTFAVLIFLWFCISMMSLLFKGLEKDKKKETKVEEVVVPVETANADEDEDEELIAVIAAAVAASLNTSVHNIVVKNIVRKHDHSPSWAKTGRIEQMNTRF